VSATTDERRRRPHGTLGVVSVLLAVLGLAALAFGMRSQIGEDPVPPTPPAATNASTVPEGSGTLSPSRDTAKPSPEVTYSPPIRVQIPKIGVDSSLVELGLDPDGVMETPTEVEKAGWFRPSPPPGIPGATVIAGHVTWDRKPVVFFELGSLTSGDQVKVTRKDGVTATFEVTRIGSFPKDAFPTKDVYARPKGSELRLITCGGEYDEAERRYLDNVIVWARLIALRP
jgi:LPXTG-site transpeptidase (sortase) family protein